jgi:acetyl esterase/lipase
MNKFKRAALTALTHSEIDIKRGYKLQRELIRLTARRANTTGLYRIWEHQTLCGDHTVPVRLFTPTQEEPHLILVFFHGGGWVTGNIDSYNAVCAEMADLTGAMVIAVDYRLAPEHPFPAGLEDCYAATRETFRQTEKLLKSPARVILIGDSAGGNLAAAVSLLAAERGEFRPDGQILIYPSTASDHSDQSPFDSIRENGEGYLLTAQRVRDFMDLYRSSEADCRDPHYAPLLAPDLTGQPDTLIITAELCPLRDEGEAYGQRLREAGCRCRIERIPNALHGYFSLPARVKPVRRTYEIINEFLREVDGNAAQ